MNLDSASIFALNGDAAGSGAFCGVRNGFGSWTGPVYPDFCRLWSLPGVTGAAARFDGPASGFPNRRRGVGVVGLMLNEGLVRGLLGVRYLLAGAGLSTASALCFCLGLALSLDDALESLRYVA